MKWDSISTKKKTKLPEHAPFAPSQYYWLNYDIEKLLSVYANKSAAKKGTKMHKFAAKCIKKRERLWKCKRTLNQFVNDAIGFGMDSEIRLYYSEHFYGKADAIFYDQNEKVLRIHDLKTGAIPAGMTQLEVYAALFFLQYADKLKMPPEETMIELRIYQNSEVIIENPEPESIRKIMDIIVEFDQVLKQADELALTEKD